MSEFSEKLMFEGLKKYFNFDNFKSDTQRKAIESVLSGTQNVYVSMPTGSGKSLCYLLPGVLQENKVTIVISPLIALIKNQMDYLNSRKIRAESLNSTLGNAERDAILADLKAVKMNTKFLYITPEQAATYSFQELLKMMIKYNKVALFAVDEAHCVSSWGHDFRKDYLKLGELRKKCKCQWIALTATAPKVVKEDVLKNLSFTNPAIFQVSCFRKNLYYDIVYKNSMQNDFPELKEYIDECLIENSKENLTGSKKACGIIYCRKKETTELVAHGLRKQGVSCQPFHSGLKKAEKEKVQNDWMNGNVSVITATVAFGMGIDKASVRFVIHWDVAQNIAAYYQESGRAGRDGKKSFCRLYYDRIDVKSIQFLLQQDMNKIADKNSNQYLRAHNAMKEFTKIVDSSESIACRHLLFTKYFGDPAPKCNAMCDVCSNKKKCEKKVDTFLQLNANNMGSKVEKDMYEGFDRSFGNADKSSFENYENDSDGDAGSYQRSEKERKEERSFIEKQFALRKMQAAESMLLQSAPKITRVRNASATETKVNGLTVQTRESSLTSIINMLRSNLESCAAKDPPELPNSKLNGDDLEQIGVNIEFRCFEAVRAVSIYRRNYGLELMKIKKSSNLFEEIKNYIPKKREARGGDYDSIMENLKDRYGKDVVKELQDEIKGTKKAELRSKVKKPSSHSRHGDGKSQTKISSFFTQNSQKDENVVHSSGSEDMSVVDIKSEKHSDDDNDECQQQFELIAPADEIITDNCINNEAINGNDLTSREKSPKASNNEAAAAVEVGAKRKIESEKIGEPSSKISRFENFGTFQKASDLLKSRLDSSSSKASDLKEDKREAMHKEWERKRAKNKGKTSSLVMNFLNKKYKEKKFGGEDPKALFKLVARRITHMFHDQNPETVPKQKEVEKYINTIFEVHETLTSVSDLDKI